MSRCGRSPWRRAPLTFYPLVMMDVTLAADDAQPKQANRWGFGPMSTFTHMRAFPPPEFKAVPWANFDTLYSLAWLDLTAGPLIISTPDTGGRYFLLPIQDMWTDVFAVPGKRTSGTQVAHFAVVPPGWRGDLPADVQRIQATTPYGLGPGADPDRRCRGLRGCPPGAGRVRHHATVAVGPAAGASNRGI